MKMQDVRKIAKTKGINSFGKTKVGLIREIQKAEGNFDCFKTAEAFCDQELCSFRSDCLENLPASKKKMNYPAASGRGIFKNIERPKGRGIKPKATQINRAKEKSFAKSID